MSTLREAKRTLTVSAILVLVAGLVGWAGPQASTETGDGSTLAVLYAGHPRSARERNFVAFLRKHLGKVETTDLKTFRESQCDGFDVTILDYDGDLFKAPRPLFSDGFSRPVITVGVPGAFICSQRDLKTGYL